MANAGQRSRIILLIVFLLFIVGGSAILLYNTPSQPGQLHAEATATVAAKTMVTAQANLRSTAHVKATTQIRNKATATAESLAFAHATATASSQQKLYAQLTSAQPTFYDPLNQQDSHRWEKDSKAGGGGCTFINGAYHAVCHK